MGQNEPFARVNDSIRQLAAANDSGAQDWEFICECPDFTCHALVSLTVSEFDERRTASPPVPIVAAEHGHKSIRSVGRLPVARPDK